MSNGMHWYPRYPGDYSKDTAHLSMMEHGAYILLLDHYYSTGPIDTKQCFSNASLMPDHSRIYRIAGAHTKEETQAVDNVIMYFFFLKDGFYHQKRADEVIEKQRQSHEKRSSAGAKGGKAKASSNATPMPQHSLSNQNQNHILDVVDTRGVKKQISILVGAEDDPRWYGNLQRIDQWIANGWDPELDIYPTIKVVMSKRTAPPQSAKYFEQAIADAHAKRTNPQPLPKGNPNHGTHQPTREQRINDALERAWVDTEYTPDPGQETPSLAHTQAEFLDVQPVREIPRRP